MKKTAILSSIFLFCSITIFAQHPLIGTWEFISIKGSDFDGKSVELTTANMREIKVITPTHYMLIQHVVRNDSVIFYAAHAGTVKIDGNKYIETTTITSAENQSIAKTDFTWKVKEDQFIQAGTITLADGKTYVIDESIFQKVKSAPENSNSPVIGTWNQLSSEYTLFDGTKGSHVSPKVKRFDIITPTHWMRFGQWEGKFQNAVIGSITMQKNKIIPTIIIGSQSIDNSIKYELSYRVDGSKLYMNGTAINGEGKKMIWSDVFEKMEK